MARRDRTVEQRSREPERKPKKPWGLVLLLLVAAVALWRRGQQPHDDAPPRWSPLYPLTNVVDWQVGWHRLPWPLGLGAIVLLRRQLRRENLHDPSRVVPVRAEPASEPPAPYNLKVRSADGRFNDLARPEMGSRGMRFGRNVPVAIPDPYADPDILSPDPRTVSRVLLTRHEFQPAPGLNVLAAAWIQFMIRDWFSHGHGDPEQPPWEMRLTPDDDWPQSERPMTVLRTLPDPTRPDGLEGAPPTHRNFETHWWDASQIYGSDAEYQGRVRTGSEGKLRVDANGFPEIDVESPSRSPTPKHPADVPGFWVGLALLQTVFTLEHNAVCDHFRREFPDWSDEELFQHARLVIAALLAKIHTVEWTPAIIPHPATERAMRLNWWGIAGEQVGRLVGRIGDGDVISGAPGSRTQHFGEQYALTEEFVSVYRMHPLIPDEYTFHDTATHRVLMERDFAGVAQRPAMEVLGQVSATDLFYSLGTAHPGAITLHNFPKGLQEFRRPDGRMQDLAATDILRTRELGVPRYNAFRRLLHMRPVANFHELSDNPLWAEELREVYGGEIERVDLMTGMFAEPKIPGLGFSDPAFRIFVLMAPRRLKSDRFLTADFTPEVYTQTGLDWVWDNTMGTVVQRHFPRLAPSLRGVNNAFAPWVKAG